jgi:serine/threonine protein kinase
MKKEKTYYRTKLIGKGTYGTVYRAKDEDGNEIYALKKIKLQGDDEGIPSTAIREICLLKELNHINIEKLKDVIHASKKITLVFEYIDRDLKKIIDATMGEGLELKLIKSYLYQLLKGMAYIHKYKILHRDLKPQNLLISNDNILKIADFGLARGYGIPVKNYTHEVVTLWYRPPDVLLGNKTYGTTVDMWSIGCIFAEMASGKPLFTGNSEVDQLKKIFEIMGTPTDNYASSLKELPEWGVGDNNFEEKKPQNFKELIPNLDNEGIDLLQKFLQLEPDKRISCEEALKHPFFDDILSTVKKLYGE